MSHDDRHAPDEHAHGGSVQAVTVIDPVCGMDVTPGEAEGGSAEHAGITYWFCNPSCRERFVADPARFLAPAPAAPPAGGHADTRIYTCPMHPEIRQVGPGACPKCGMALEPLDPIAADEGPSPELVDMTRRFWVSLILTIPVFAFAMGEMIAPALTRRIDPAAALWVQLLLATPVVLWGGWPFFVRGWQSLVTRSLNMFTLIALGTAAAYGYSVFAVLAPGALPHGVRHGGAPPVYFEAAAVITTLVLLGQVLELRARSATSAPSARCWASRRGPRAACARTAARRTCRSPTCARAIACACGRARRCPSTAWCSRGGAPSTSRW